MKNKTLLLLTFVAFTISINAQNEWPRGSKQTFDHGKNILKLNALSFLTGTIEMSYERALNPNISVIGSGGYAFDLLDENIDGFQVGGEFRFYWSGKKLNAPRGWHLGPVITYAKATDALEGRSVSGLGTGFTLGYQWVWESGFALDLALSPQYLNLSGDTTDDHRLVVPVQVGFGYNF